MAICVECDDWQEICGALSRIARGSAATLGPPMPSPKIISAAIATCARVKQQQFTTTIHIMSDTEMDGGIALDVASPAHSTLVTKINGGAMDMNGNSSVADSTATGRLYVLRIHHSGSSQFACTEC